MIFEKHFDLAHKFNLPMYFHVRSAHEDFLEIVTRNKQKLSRGAIHCFTGNFKQLSDYLEIGLYVGLTLLSFRTEQNIETIK